eukprot:s127_g20.t1
MAPIAAFMFPMASGHTNPSLPLARRLVNLGWTVHFLSFPPFREAVEDTGSTFVDSRRFVMPSMDTIGLHRTGSDCHSLDAFDPNKFGLVLLMCSAIYVRHAVPALLKYFEEIYPDLVVYCPHLCACAHLAARCLKIRSVSLLTLPGPGSMEKIVQTGGLTGAELCKLLAENSPQLEAIEALKKDLALPDLTLNTSLPLHGDHYSDLNLVTTTENLADEWEDDAATYAAQGKAFAFLGPLIDVAGAKRCAGFKKEVQEELLPKRAVDEEFPMDVVESAVAAGRGIVLVSLGTVITGDSSNHGWKATDGSSMTGKQLCQAVFKAVFAELGDPAEGGSHGLLLVVAVGPQADALEGVQVPGNAICRNVLPQVDILRLKPRVFVTHGGQNSFMESMFVGTPLVVCPGFADQPANGAKAQAMKVGLCVDRPVSDEGAATYGEDVRDALRRVLEVPAFKHSADRVAQGLRQAGGVDRAIQLLIEGRT